MTKHQQHKFNRLIIVMSEVYDIELSVGVLRSFQEVLKPFDLHFIDKAILNHLSSMRYGKAFPTPAHILHQLYNMPLSFDEMGIYGNVNWSTVDSQFIFVDGVI